MKFVKQLLALILLFAVLPAPVIQAEGGVAVQPYWTFSTDAPVTHIQTGDINGDGTLEVVMTTANGSLYVVKNNGDLAWHYQLGTKVNDLIVADMDGEGQTAEIYVAGRSRDIMLSDTARPAWALSWDPILAVSAADLDGDGQRELVSGDSYSTSIMDSKTGSIPQEVGLGRPTIDIWVGDVDGDGRPEIVPNLAGGHEVYVLEDNLKLAWEKRIAAEVGLIQAGDVDGDGQAEVVILTTAWELLLLANGGQEVWHNQGLSVEPVLIPPTPGEMIVHDLDGDGQSEIIVLTPDPAGTVHVYKGDGHQVWSHPLDLAPVQDNPVKTAEFSPIPGLLSASGPAGILIAADINSDDQAEVMATIAGQEQVYLLDAAGHRLADYYVGKTTGALACADLNGDGSGEIIIGTETGLQVFGASAGVERRELWQVPFLGDVTALDLADLEGDGRGEVIAGFQEGQIYALAGDGYTLWEVDLKTSPNLSKLIAPTVLALSTGDVDGDGQQEVAVAGGSQVYLLKNNRPSWAVPSQGALTVSVAVHDLDGDGQAEIITGGYTTGGAGRVELLDGTGKRIWQRDVAERVRVVGSAGEQILAGTDSGRVYRLTAVGASAGAYELEARVLSLGAGQAATAAGQVYRLDEDGPILVRDLGASPRKIQLSAEVTAILTEAGEVRLVGNDGTTWQGTLDSRPLSLAIEDLNGDGQVEIAVGTDKRQVHLFGLTVDQPPLLTNPGLADTRTGYAYSVDINEPDSDMVTVTVEIWDPSAGLWLTGTTQPYAQGQGRLSLEVPDPFNTWDSGQESRFRFRYDDGHNQGTLKEVSGPFTIPTLPWYIYYGQFFGLGALGLLVPALGWVIYRRQRGYHRSPVGRAESLLKQLRAHPTEVLERLHTLVQTEPALLTYLPGLAREAGETSIANASEGFQLILTRPEVVVEGLRAVVRGSEKARSRGAAPAGGFPQEQGSGGDEVEDLIGNRKPEIGDLYGVCLEALEANTVNRIVALRPRLEGVTKDMSLAELGRVAQALHNYERVETGEDKIAYLAQAIETLGRLDREFQTVLPQPERNIFSRIAFTWLLVSTNALEDLQGRAQIEAVLKTRQVLSLEQAALSLELTNTGRSPASNLTINLVPDPLYTVGNGAVQLDILPAGRSVVVELPLFAPPSVEQFRAEFVITFDDRERSGKRVTFADRVRLLKPNPVFQTIPNPYAPGTPLRPGSPIFFGRDDLFQFMAENLAGATRQNILVLIGQRRMGKTSFLQQLPTRLGQAYLPVYLDGQSLGVDPGMANFFYDLSLAIADAVTDQGCAIAEPVLAEFQERPSAVFERTFLPAVFEAIGSRRLLLLFDEFEELEMRVASGNLEASIFSFFRHLMQHVDKLGFVFIGTHRLEELTADYWSILFNIALYKHVTFLSEGAARALIVKPVAKHGLLYDDLALDKMIRVTAGHPYFLQLICHALVNRANREKQTYLTIRDVNDTLAELVELGEAHFAFLWEQSSPAEQLILAALVRLLAKTPTVTAAQIVELLIERGRTLEIQGVREALRRLTERGILHEVGESPPRYEYKVDIIRLWMESYKVLGRVIEEMET